jgi:biopolymer transport protein ExbD/biopolymer transport protein TolR
MVITPMLQKGVSVDLAITNNPTLMPDADKEDSLVVAVTKDNKIYFGSELITDPSTLTEKVKDRFNNKNIQNQKVYIKADARTRYGNVVEVVDNVRAAGVDQLGLLTEQRKAPEKK